MTVPAVKISGLRHAWPGTGPVLDIEALTVEAGERVFLAGPSGSGKSTLLGLIAGVTPVQAGEVEVLGKPMPSRSPKARDRLRADQIGMIFQLFNLVPYLSSLENVLLPLSFSPSRRKQLATGGVEAADEAHRLMSALQLPSESQTRPASDLSVGQQQRVAAARALIGRPGLVVADEPTSALDADSRDAFLELLSNEVKASGAALLFVSHDRALATRFDRALDLAQINTVGEVV